MKTTKHTLLGRLILSTIFFLVSGCSTFDSYTVVGAVEKVVIHTNNGPHYMEAKVDTGALRCSIDLALANELGLKQDMGSFSTPEDGSHCKDEEVYVKSATGEECRPIFIIPMTIAESINVTGQCSGADRRGKGLKFELLIGRFILIEKQLLVNSENGLSKEEEEAEEN